jgi:hypothetical protein
MKTKNRITLTLSPNAIVALDHHGDNRSEAADRILQRYVYIIGIARANLRSIFSPEEMEFILDVLRGSSFSHPSTYRSATIEIMDAIHMNRTKDKAPFPVSALEIKLQQLTDVERAALVDAIERWRVRLDRGETVEAVEALD